MSDNYITKEQAAESFRKCDEADRVFSIKVVYPAGLLSLGLLTCGVRCGGG